MKKFNLTKMIVSTLLFLLLISISQASENKGIFQILDEKYIDNITDLPYSNGIPDKNIQSSGHIRGWIDIVGFNKMSKDVNTFYIPGKPETYAIIQEDVWGKFDCDICSYSIKKVVQVTSSRTDTTAVLVIEMTWYSKHCSKNGCTCVEHKESTTFYDIEKSPQIVEPLINPIINIIQYNNTLYENIGIYINSEDIKNATKFDIAYNNSTMTKTLKTGHVEQTNKGIYFANLTDLSSWETTGKNISQINNMTFINGNLTKINATNIKISTSNLYETKHHSNFTVSREEFRPEKETIENPLLITFWSILFVMFGTLYLAITKMRLI